MQTRRWFSLAVILILAAAQVLAVPVTVEFANGKVQIQNGTAWKALDIGDTFDSALSVRLPKGAILELTLQNGTKIVIGAAGTYSVATLIKPKAETSAMATVSAKLEKLTKAQTQSSTVAGVRGAAQDSAELMWSGGNIEADAAFEEANTTVREGNFTDAWKEFMTARELYEDAADLYGAAKAAWYASLAGLSAKSDARALAALRSASPEDAGALRGTYTLALATLSIRSGSAAEAKELLQRALAGKWFDDPALEADAKNLLSGL